MSGQKVGHYFKLKENHVNTLEAAIFAWAVWNFVRMFVLNISRSMSNIGHIGSETVTWMLEYGSYQVKKYRTQFYSGHAKTQIEHCRLNHF